MSTKGASMTKSEPLRRDHRGRQRHDQIALVPAQAGVWASQWATAKPGRGGGATDRSDNYRDDTTFILEEAVIASSDKPLRRLLGPPTSRRPPGSPPPPPRWRPQQSATQPIH